MKALEEKAAAENLIFTESQLQALERAKGEKEAHGEIETAHPGYLGAQDTYYVGTLKGVGRIYQQTFIDIYTKLAFAKLYDRKNALVAADTLNDQVLPFFETEEVRLLRVLTDRGTEYCGGMEHHEYELYLAIEDIDHTKTKARHPQTNGICERFHRTVQAEFYQVAFRKKSTTPSTNSKPTWINGFGSTTTKGHTRANIVSGARLTKPFRKPNLWPKKKCSIRSFLRQTFSRFTIRYTSILVSDFSHMSDQVLSITYKC